MVKIGKYNYELSTRPTKKLMTVVSGKKIHFGSVGMQHFDDKTHLRPKNESHKDLERKRSYLSRAKGIKNKQKELTKDKPTSSNYHAIRILWT